MKVQQRIADAMRNFVENRYRPAIELALKWRTVTVLSFVLVFVLCIGVVGGGWIRVAFFPSIVADFVGVNIDLPENAAFSRTTDIQDRLERAAKEAADEMTAEGFGALDIVLSFATGSALEAYAFPEVEGTAGIDATEFSKRWRAKLGPVPEAEEIRMTTSIQEARKPIDIQVAGPDGQEMERAISAIKAELSTFGGIFDIKDSISDPQPEIVLNLRPQAESLALGLNDLAQQVRQGYFGAEAQRVPRGKDDVRVMVRYPRSTRESIESLADTRIRVGDGIEIPFDAVAETNFGTGAVKIEREDRRRVGHITADALDSVDPNQVVAELFKNNADAWARQFPRTSITLAGDAEEQSEFIGSLATNLFVAVCVIYAILAVSFRSYGLPIIILTAIPFGFSGAVIGHMLLGMSLSMFSLLGIIAAAGVVVNDNLVLLDHLGRLRKEGMKVADAIVNAACDRFRAIILTSLTTFIGLAPLMAETSVQAQLLIPMVVSLAFGVLFATGVTLVLVPCLYSLMWQVKHGVLRRVRRLLGTQDTGGLTTPAE
jgi:multidrug efflux pump subunit AcrB